MSTPPPELPGLVLPGIDRFARALTRVEVPAEDRELSPHTGLTRAHWLAAADDLLLSAARYRSPGGARLDLPGPVSQQGVRTDGLEAFARTFLLAAFRHVGERGEDPHGHLDRYLEGVVSGTRTPGRDDADSWPVIGHIGRHGQPHVEAASVALSMHLTKADSWDRLAPDEQDRLDAWLRNALGNEPASNNWYLFPLTIASFLEGVGRADRQTSWVIERGIGLIDQWYRGEGWYSDGDGQAFDHYIGWALHLYPLLHARLRGDRALEDRLAARLDTFLSTFAPTFDRNGAPLHYGRSLTYRTGTLASLAMGAVTGRSPLRPGQTRRVLSACLRYFLERGSTEDGLFTLGWHGPHQPTVQRYSGPGSPYWASKGFAALMLPADHPLWTATEEAPEWERTDQVTAVAPAGLLLQRTAGDGLVRVHNHGSDHIKPHAADSGAPDPLYARLAYSTRTGPTSLHNAPDNDISVQYRGIWSVRRRIHMLPPGGDNWLASWHAPRFPQYAPFDASPDANGGPVLPSVRIDSVVAVDGVHEVRIHRLANVPPGAPVRLSGWAVAGPDREALTAHASGASATVTTAGSATGEGPLTSRLTGLHGWVGAAAAIAPGGTAYGAWSVVPELHGEADERGGGLYVAYAALASSAPGDEGPVPAVEVDGARVRVAWTGDRPDTVIDLAHLGGTTP
ncbi:DUF2264 domain-containing protein [Streptomyces sp. SBT349]|uniref:DUF2264 domain-containing protein n=1 Tax=Streptomyces sp. SBT349 TaxID=1580539 RepID=UPI00099D3259|nr:DUF2264 domain-containing protein [Streptomyces sp. SBT349]